MNKSNKERKVTWVSKVNSVTLKLSFVIMKKTSIERSFQCYIQPKENKKKQYFKLY